MSMLWTEKYRPQKLSELLGQPGFVIDAEHWVEDRDMPNVLLHGVAGTGKTTAALVLAKSLLKDEAEGNFFEINASDDRKLETVRNRIKDIATTRKLGDVPFKIILLDEMDGMTKDAQNALKRIMERYSHNCRFIITCNDRFRIIQPLISRCANYAFRRVNNESMRFALEKVIQNETKNGTPIVNESELEPFIEGLHGDLRRGITELQAAVSGKTSLLKQSQSLLEPYEKIIQMVENNEYDNANKEVHNLLYQAVDMKTVCVNLHDVVIGLDIQHTTKFKLLRVIGEAEWRSSNMTPKVLASWMIGQMI
tara:strand:+ start:2286 stop:3212 length:927 start_codon:yes stop_codon:yes gene_type:complete